MNILHLEKEIKRSKKLINIIGIFLIFVYLVNLSLIIYLLTKHF